MSGIKTLTGIMFDPLTPDTDKIHIQDIAHALPLLFRSEDKR